jgi:hypothetical protein
VRRGSLAVIATLVLLTACQSDSDDDTSERASGPVCAGIDSAIVRPEITFVRDGRLEAIGVDGKGRRCLLQAVPTPADGSMTWSDDGKTLLIGTTVYRGSRPVALDLGPVLMMSLSPPGSTLVTLGRDRRLRRHSLVGGPATDITFLERTDEVAVHPTGGWVAAVGQDASGRYGITLATELGRSPRSLAPAEAARSIWSLTFSRDGQTLWFLDDHHGPRHLHAVDIPSGEVHTEEPMRTPTGPLMLSPFDPSLVVYRATCQMWALRPGAGLGTNVATRPIGYVKSGRMVVLTGCDGAGKVQLRSQLGGAPSAQVVEDVEAASIRQTAPQSSGLP